MPDHYLLCATEAKFVTNKPHTLIITCGVETNQMLIKISEAKIKRRSNDTTEISSHPLSSQVTLSTTSSSWMYSVRTKGGKTAGRPPQQYVQMKRMGVYQITTWMEHVTSVSLRVGDTVYDLPHWTPAEHAERMASLPSSPSHRSRAVMRRDQYLNECKEHVVVRRMAESEPSVSDQPRVKKLKVDDTPVMTTTSSTWVPEHDSPISTATTPNSVSGEPISSYGLDFHYAPIHQGSDPSWAQSTVPISQSQYMGYLPSPRYSALTSPRLPPLSHEEMDLFGGTMMGLEGYKPEVEDNAGGAHDFVGSLLAPLSPAGFGADLIHDEDGMQGILDDVDVSPHSSSPSPSSSPTSPSQGSSQPPMERSLSSFSFSSDSDLSLEDALDVQLDELTAMGVPQQLMGVQQNDVGTGIQQPYLEPQPFIQQQLQQIQQVQPQVGLAPTPVGLAQDLQVQTVQNYAGLHVDMEQGPGHGIIQSQQVQSTQVVPHQPQHSQIPQQVIPTQLQNSQIPQPDTSQILQVTSQSPEVHPLVQEGVGLPSHAEQQSPLPSQLLQSTQIQSNAGIQRPNLGTSLLVLQSSQLSAGLLFSPIQQRGDVRISTSRDTVIPQDLAISPSQNRTSSQFQQSLAISPTSQSSQQVFASQSSLITQSSSQVITSDGGTLVTTQPVSQAQPQVMMTSSHLAVDQRQVGSQTPSQLQMDTSVSSSQAQMVADTSPGVAYQPIQMLVDTSPGGAVSQSQAQMVVDTSPGVPVLGVPGVVSRSQAAPAQGYIPLQPTVIFSQSSPRPIPASQQSQHTNSSQSISTNLMSTILTLSLLPSIIDLHSTQRSSSRTPQTSRPQSRPQHGVNHGDEDMEPLQSRSIQNSSHSETQTHNTSSTTTYVIPRQLQYHVISEQSQSNSRQDSSQTRDTSETQSQAHVTSQQPQLYVTSQSAQATDQPLQAQTITSQQSQTDVTRSGEGLSRTQQPTTSEPFSMLVRNVSDESYAPSEAQATPTVVQAQNYTSQLRTQTSAIQNHTSQVVQDISHSHNQSSSRSQMSQSSSRTPTREPVETQPISRSQVMESQQSSHVQMQVQIQETDMDMDIQQQTNMEIPQTIPTASSQPQPTVLFDSWHDLMILRLGVWRAIFMIFHVFIHIIFSLFQIMSSTQHDLVQPAGGTASQMDSQVDSVSQARITSEDGVQRIAITTTVEQEHQSRTPIDISSRVGVLPFSSALLLSSSSSSVQVHSSPIQIDVVGPRILSSAVSTQVDISEAQAQAFLSPTQVCISDVSHQHDIEHDLRQHISQQSQVHERPVTDARVDLSQHDESHDSCVISLLPTSTTDVIHTPDLIQDMSSIESMLLVITLVFLRMVSTLSSQQRYGLLAQLSVPNPPKLSRGMVSRIDIPMNMLQSLFHIQSTMIHYGILSQMIIQSSLIYSYTLSSLLCMIKPSITRTIDTMLPADVSCDGIISNQSVIANSGDDYGKCNSNLQSTGNMKLYNESIKNIYTKLTMESIRIPMMNLQNVWVSRKQGYDYGVSGSILGHKVLSELSDHVSSCLCTVAA